MESTSEIILTVSWSLGCFAHRTQLWASCFTLIIQECFFFSQSYLLSLGTYWPCHVSFFRTTPNTVLILSEAVGSISYLSGGLMSRDLCCLSFLLYSFVISHRSFPSSVQCRGTKPIAEMADRPPWTRAQVQWAEKHDYNLYLINVQFIKHHFSVPATISGTLSKDTQRESVITNWVEVRKS